MTYAEKIKKLRDVMFISQGELAGALNVSIITVNRWENGKFTPTIKTKKKLNELFLKHNISAEREGKVYGK